MDQNPLWWLHLVKGISLTALPHTSQWGGTETRVRRIASVTLLSSFNSHAAAVIKIDASIRQLTLCCSHGNTINTVNVFLFFSTACSDVSVIRYCNVTAALTSASHTEPVWNEGEPDLYLCLSLSLSLFACNSCGHLSPFWSFLYENIKALC